MTEVTLKELLEAGVHFGHQTKRWNPKMKPYIFGARDGIYIISIQKTLKHLIEARKFMMQIVADGGSVLFVGTKKQAQDIITEEAKKCGMLYVTTRWLGGTLTNFQTVRRSINRLIEMEKMETDERFSKLTKKEMTQFRHEKERLMKYFDGMRDMKDLPQALFVIDTKKEHIPIQEARKKGIPVVAVVDTNCDPVGIQHVIPGNDDGIRSIRLFISKIAEACLEGARLREEKLRESVAPPPTEQTGPPAGAENPPQAPQTT